MLPRWAIRCQCWQVKSLTVSFAHILIQVPDNFCGCAAKLCTAPQCDANKCMLNWKVSKVGVIDRFENIFTHNHFGFSYKTVMLWLSSVLKIACCRRHSLLIWSNATRPTWVRTGLCPKHSSKLTLHHPDIFNSSGPLFCFILWDSQSGVTWFTHKTVKIEQHTVSSPVCQL